MKVVSLRKLRLHRKWRNSIEYQCCSLRCQPGHMFSKLITNWVDLKIPIGNVTFRLIIIIIIIVCIDIQSQTDNRRRKHCGPWSVHLAALVVHSTELTSRIHTTTVLSSCCTQSHTAVRVHCDRIREVITQCKNKCLNSGMTSSEFGWIVRWSLNYLSSVDCRIYFEKCLILFVRRL